MNATVKITTASGVTSGEIPLDAIKKAARKTAKQYRKEKADPQVEAFSEKETGEANVNAVTRDQLRSFVERIERLEEEKKTIVTDIKDVFGEAKSMGFDTKILRKVVAIRKQDRDERMEQEAILQTYLIALGMSDGGYL